MVMDKKEKKTLLITGGSRGIGKAVAIEFGKAGFNVAVNYVPMRERPTKWSGRYKRREVQRWQSRVI